MHFAKIKGQPIPELESEPATNTSKRQLENGGEGEEEDPEAKRRRVLEESRDVDADSEDDEEDSSEDDRLVALLSGIRCFSNSHTQRRR